MDSVEIDDDWKAVESQANEHTFYRRLLELTTLQHIEPLLDEAMTLIIEMTGANAAYLELYDENENQRFWRAHHIAPKEIEAVRSTISQGIIAKSIAEGSTIETPSAQDDVRFTDLGSVRRNEIGAVLCAPVGKPPIGVIYLQNRQNPGSFAARDRENVEMFARQLAAVADRLLASAPRQNTVDYTAEVRKRFPCSAIIGRSKSLARVLQAASLVAPLDIDTMITGPSGTGKTALASAIALAGPRANKPFVSVNCAAIPEGLIESELFGAERGAHSTAHRKTIGKVAAADGGTLFLDEIAELSAAAQAKLLHLLQQREYSPLGSPTTVKADIRVISATNADLKALVARAQFREDLYYRVHVLPLEMPGLDERRDDIPELVKHFTNEVCRKHGFMRLEVTRRALLMCREGTWAGHVRQLQHAIEGGVIRAHGEGATTLDAHHLFVEEEPTEKPVSYQESTRLYQRRILEETLERNGWNVAETSRELDLARSYVYNLIKEFKLERSGSN
ncbi:MAG: sigma-54-dependent Fis family transcriptional regulator [Kofleriaceae bacterium]